MSRLRAWLATLIGYDRYLKNFWSPPALADWKSKDIKLNYRLREDVARKLDERLR